METFSALLAICARNSQVTGEFPAEWPVTRSFDFFFDRRLNKHLSKNREAGDLKRHCTHYDVTVMNGPVFGFSNQCWEHGLFIHEGISVATRPATGQYHHDRYVLLSFWGPFHERLFHRNSNSMDISFCSDPLYIWGVAMKLYTWHDMSAVVACAKVCSDMMPYNGVTLNQFSVKFELRWKIRS